jgi:hypothetical protein
MQTEKIIAFIRQNLLAFVLGAGSLGLFFFYSLNGKECFNCEQTQTFKPDQPGGRATTGLRFRHK